MRQNSCISFFKLLGSIFLFFIILTGCKSSGYETRSFYSMGTIVEITLPENNTDVFEKLVAKMEELNDKISTETQNINNAPTGKDISISKHFYFLLQRAAYYNNLSSGKFDITIYTISKLYGFPEGPYSVPDNETIKKHVQKAGFENISFTPKTISKKTDLKIDTGAYSKGYIVDLLVDILKKNNINSGIINAGGDLYLLGTKENRQWRIAIKNPDKGKKYLSVVSFANKAVVTSGNYERYFIDNQKRYTHIFDAETFESVNNYRSVSVIAQTTEEADGLATVFYLMDIDEIGKICSKTNTPVFIYTLDSKKIRMCGWQKYEVSH